MADYHRKNFLIILIAPSGGGKSTIAKKILNDCPNIEYSISYTTRKPRGNEENGKAYHFITEEEFKKRTEENDFLEYAYVHGNWYGTSQSFIKTQLARKKHVLLDIDFHGAKQITGSGIDAVTIFILPPTESILKQRLTARGTDTEEIIRKRLFNAKKEVEEINNFQYLIINDVLEEAITQVKQIIQVEENRISRYENIYNTFYGGQK